MLAVFENLRAVDENMFHPDRILVRFIEGRVTGNRCWIERYDISERRH